ncbi:MAG TPA: hypothetical protein DCF33_19230, partial [Saprospirales bacterium]|nr:hypothetical protein [Saprospirales bacterium]
MRLEQAIRRQPFPGWVENVPAYASLTVFYRPEQIVGAPGLSPYQFVQKALETLLASLPESAPEMRKVVTVPVCYEAECGPDLDDVAALHGISREQVIALHQQQDYQVYMMGFLPGFAYMGILKENLATPRKNAPRARVPAGSVGIAGRQTGVYPLDSPGGWQIIGRTPLKMFDPDSPAPFLLQTGASVRFQTITREEFDRYAPTPQEPSLPSPNASHADAVVLRPGPYATLQDLGRTGFRASGVPVSGAMDQQAHRMANALVGNTPQAATIECTMGGLSVQFQKATRIALAGSGAAAINGQPLELYQPYAVAAQDVLEIRFQPPGLRIYLAVKGGFDAPVILNSKSMSTLIGIGAPLKKGDLLWFDQETATVPPELPNLSAPAPSTSVRVFRGPEFEWLRQESRERFFTQPYTLSHRFDRMGCHVQAEPLTFSTTRELLSTAVTPGTIQCTPAGQLILLMQDCQTTGGYPRVGQIAAVDLPRVAQWVPGEQRFFSEISFEEAESLYMVDKVLTRNLACVGPG